MSVRVSPTEKIRGQIDALFEEGIDLAAVLEEVARLGARLIMQTAVEAEVEEFLGRARYQRAAGLEDARVGSRNGFCPTTVKTTAGPVTIERPKLRGTTEKFASRLFGAGVTRTNALESLVIAGYVWGLSDWDVEATLADALGSAATLSRSTVSRVCEAIKTEFAAWAERPPCQGRAGLPVRRRVVVHDARRGPRRTGPRGLGDHHHGRAGAGRPGPGRQ